METRIKRYFPFGMQNNWRPCSVIHELFEDILYLCFIEDLGVNKNRGLEIRGFLNSEDEDTPYNKGQKEQKKILQWFLTDTKLSPRKQEAYSVIVAQLAANFWDNLFMHLSHLFSFPKRLELLKTWDLSSVIMVKDSDQMKEKKTSQLDVGNTDLLRKEHSTKKRQKTQGVWGTEGAQQLGRPIWNWKAWIYGHWRLWWRFSLMYWQAKSKLKTFYILDGEWGRGGGDFRQDGQESLLGEGESGAEIEMTGKK